MHWYMCLDSSALAGLLGGELNNAVFRSAPENAIQVPGQFMLSVRSDFFASLAGRSLPTLPLPRLSVKDCARVSARKLSMTLSNSETPPTKRRRADSNASKPWSQEYTMLSMHVTSAAEYVSLTQTGEICQKGTTLSCKSIRLDDHAAFHLELETRQLQVEAEVQGSEVARARADRVYLWMLRGHSGAVVAQYLAKNTIGDALPPGSLPLFASGSFAGVAAFFLANGETTSFVALRLSLTTTPALR